MKSETTILLIGAAIAGYLLFAGKKEGEGGTGGSLITPAYPDWFSGATAPVSSAPIDSSFTISEKILAAMAGTGTKKESAISIAGTDKSFMVPEKNILTSLGLNQIAVNPYALEKSAQTGSTVNLGTYNNKNYVTGYGDIPMSANTVAVNPYVLSPVTTKKAAVSVPSTGAFYSSSAARGQSRGGWGV